MADNAVTKWTRIVELNIFTKGCCEIRLET